MRILFFIAIMLSPLHAHSQKGKTRKLDCKFLNAAIVNNRFQKAFMPCSDTTIVFEIVDSAGTFADCRLIGSCGKIATISRVFPLGANPNLRKGEVTRSQIVLYKTAKFKNSIIIGFWKPYNNNNLVLRMLYKHNKITSVKVVQSGVF